MSSAMSGIIVFDEKLVEERDYWINRLSQNLHPSSLNPDFPRLLHNANETETVSITLEGKVYDELMSLTGGSGFLTYVILMSALKVCLYKYTGNRTVVVGSPARRTAENGQPDGNLVAILDHLESSESFQHLLLSVRQTLLDAYAHQRYPFRRLLDDLHVVVDPAGPTPFFQVALSYSAIHLPLPECDLDLHLSFSEDEGQRLRGALRFNPSLFRRVTIERFASHLLQLLSAALKDTTVPLERLSLLGAGERQQLLLEWNDTTRVQSSPLFLECFQAQVAQRPDALAVSSAAGALTYGALDARANQLARYLRHLGLGAEVCVALYLPRTADLVVALVGVLKAGAAVLLLDAGLPARRLRFLLEDAGVPLLLTQQAWVERVPNDTTASLLCLDSDWESIAGESSAPLGEETMTTVPLPAAQQLAYVVYTSGSSGEPKGVGVEHGALANLVSWHLQAYGVSAADRATQVAGLSFDAALWEFCPYLAAGASLHLVEEGERAAPERLRDWLWTEAITISFLPTPLAEALLDGGWRSGLALRRLLTGGDRLHGGPAAGSSFEFYNNYGPTENAVVTSWIRVDAEQEAAVGSNGTGPVKRGRTPAIGRPVDNTRVYLLDGQQQVVAAGIEGELCIAGASLARGYLGRAELTAERFVPDPFSARGGGRLYRTGDICRWRWDGALEFSGRRDEQVKVRGYRIELGEIEATLAAHASVRQVAVVARESGGGAPQLYAYLSLGATTAPPPDWRRYLAERLPEYMIPAAFLVLEELPLTANGKVDRQGLPAPAEVGGPSAERYKAPQTESERVLAAVWSEVLGAERVGVRDNFFELGGDSIRSIQVAAKAAERGLALTIEQLFEYPTLGELAQVVGATSTNGTSTESTTAAAPFSLVRESDRQRLPAGLEDAYPLTRLQAGMIFHSQYSPETAVYHNIISLHLQAPLELAVMQQTIDELLARHAVLRTSFALSGYSEPLQLVHGEVRLPLMVQDLSHLSAAEQEQEIAAQLAAEKRRPFVWDEAPLLRLRVWHRSATSFHLMMIFHHAILDGWSDATLLTELFQRYFYLLGTGATDLGPGPQTSFRDYVALERQALASEAEQAYWRQQVSEYELLEVPRWSRGSGSLAPRQQVRRLDGSLYEGLQELAQQWGVALKSLLLAAHLRVQSWLARQERVMTGLVTHGRPETADGERVVGLFLNTLPLCVRLDGGSWRELVRAVVAAEQQLLAHRWYPLPEIQQQAGGRQLFEVAFGYLHFHVYQELGAHAEQLALLGIEGVSETNFTLLTCFAKDPSAARMNLTLMYDAGALSDAQVSALGNYYMETLEQMVAVPTGRYELSGPLTGAERQQLLLEWNDTSRPYPHHLSLPQLFDAQVQRTPDAVAVVYDDQQLSYAELDQRSNQLAQHLRTLGLGLEDRVALCLPRSLEMLVGMLAILKVGAAYVPLDPQYPSERLSFMLEDAGVSALLTAEALVERLPQTDVPLVRLDADWPLIARESAVAPVVAHHPQQLAYLIYTSGSTGTPKASGVSHRAILRLVCNSNYLQPRATDCVAQASNASFDAATFELWAPLLHGGRISGVQTQTVLAPLEFARWLYAQQVTTLFLTTALFNQMVREAAWGLLGVEQVLFGGQAVEPRWVAALMDQGYRGRLLHVYGPTEVTTFATWWEVREVAAEQATVPIGRALSNTSTYLLDEWQQPVGVGIEGELYLGGDGLARGYLGRAELTAERFVPDPFSARGGERLYRTGDICRWRWDGALEFSGRRDEQVKVRGYRIELGEIEVVLGRHEAVAAAAVVVRQEREGEQQLVGYLVWKDGAEVADVSEVRRWLREQVPDYMVPGMLVAVEGLPLTENGKVDRRQLAAWAAERAGVESGREYLEPRTAVEELVAGIWAEVLGVERVGRSDNFFDLGGHSLLATQVMSRVRERLGVEVGLRRLFEEPTVEGLAETIEAVLRGQAAEGAEGDEEETHAGIEPLRARARGELIPLSFAQQRLWFIDQLNPNSTFYNIPAALRLKGSLHTEALAQSLSEITRRHEALRTTFPQKDGQPFQQIAEAQPLRLMHIDLSELDHETQEKQIHLLTSEECRRPFNLSQGPLYRVSLLSLGAEDHVLLITMHHMVSDGWSIGILVQEFATLYRTYIAGDASPLPDLPVQYADFATWQREWLQGEVLEKQLIYWRNQLADSSHVLDLPTDRRRPPVPSYRGAHESVVVSASLTHQLKALGRQEGVTLFMFLLAAFQTLLYRYTGQGDLSTGTPIAGRTRAEVEGLIGYFVNTLVLRTQLSEAPTFRDLLAHVRNTALGAYAHQELPFEKLVEILQPEREMSHNPLFQVFFGLHNLSSTPLSLPNLTLEPIRLDTMSARFDLAIDFQEAGDSLIGSIEYSTDLFEAETIIRLGGHLHNLLESIVAAPTQPLSTLPLLSETERQRVLVEWNTTETTYPQRAAHELFEAHAAQDPEAVALSFGEQHLTYKELNRRANQLAHYLQRLAVGPESLVGLYVSPSLEMVVGILGILKAGGAYVPLDPAYPAERIAFMLEDAQVQLLLTQEHLIERTPSRFAQYICLDTHWPMISSESEVNPVSGTGADNAAYVIYTSGSTGQPKGVVGLHRGIVNRCQWMWENYPYEAGEVCCQKTSLSFVDAVAEIFGPLLKGVPTVIIPEASVKNSQQLIETLVLHQVTRLVLVPSLLAVLLAAREHGLAEGLSVKTWVSSGEALPPELVTKFEEQISGGRLLNLYGSSEVAADVTWCEATGAKETFWQTVIGRPLSNSQIYLLDQHWQPAPTGVAGEIYVAGDGMARGYLRRPDLTAERFLPSPYSATPGTRIYKTGDLARLRSDGDIVYLGRADHQVKVRGYRIELGEIETVLKRHPDVKDVVVVARGEQPEQKQLVAYLVVEDEPGPTALELKSYMREQLPEYMVPAIFMRLEQLPLSGSGKVDRRALPAPNPMALEEEERAETRLTATEELVAGIWMQLLGVETVNARDNFFDLGGHSLLATQVISRIKEIFHVELPLRELFEAPTLAGLAARIGEHCTVSDSQPETILPVGRNTPLPLSYAQQRLWFMDQLEPGDPSYNMSMAIRLTGALQLAALSQSFTELRRRHEVLRTTFAEGEASPVQVIHTAEPVPLFVVDLSGLSETEQEAQALRLATEDRMRPFDLTRGPLFQVSLLKLGGDEVVTLPKMHHIVSDAWSIGILMREVGAIYNAFAHGQASALPDLPFQYADFAVWQQNHLQGEVLDDYLSYWKRQLGGTLPVLKLPTDRAQPRSSSRGNSHFFELSPRLTSALKSLSQREGATLFMTLLAAFNTLLYRYSEQDDIIIGADIANRNQAGTEKLIGFFVNMLALRANLSGNPTFHALLQQVREMTLQAYTYQELPFDKLVEHLQPQRGADRSPIFRVVFNLNNVPLQAREMSGLKIASLFLKEETARFDLSLLMTETPAGLVGSWVYSADLFEAATISRLAGHFNTILESVVADPEVRVDEVEVLTEAEKEQQALEKKARAEANLQKLISVKRTSAHA
jgi:amino acid adenylation domain-containing protein